MNEHVLNHFQDLAEALSERPKKKVDITLRNGRTLQATFDPMFSTFTIGGITVPEQELSFWTKTCWGAKVATITGN